jgi:hypothetical protein
MRGLRYHLLAAAVSGALMLGPGAGPAEAVEDDQELVAYLDGEEIPVSEVGRYHCDDFAYPVIRCSVSPLLSQARRTVVTLLSGVEYVTIYDLPSFSGASMTLSQDYATLMTIGWDDRISSFKGKLSATGKFWTDWFMGGSYWWFCCNQQVSSLGTSSNTFSSVQRT